MSYEVIGTTYDGKKLVKTTINGATINAGATATFTASVPSLFVKQLVYIDFNTSAPGAISGPFNVSVSCNSVSFTLYSGTTTSISTIDVLVEVV
jgi:hypothetical protein